MSEQPTKSNEWYTPLVYCDAARKVFGGVIDLDPASCEKANWRVQARTYYTKEQDGLSLPWFGNVWCNPPYKQEYPGHSSIRAWTRKAIACYRDGIIEQAILLVPNDASTRWFEALWPFLVCFPSKRIKFDAEDLRKLEQPTFGTCFVYMGSNKAKFASIFSEFGTIVQRIDIPPAKPTNLELWSA